VRRGQDGYERLAPGRASRHHHCQRPKETLRPRGGHCCTVSDFNGSGWSESPTPFTTSWMRFVA
jgi:hypothetical protein